MKKEIQITLPKIVTKLKSGAELNEIERQMAAGCIEDWLRVKKAQIKAATKYDTDEERREARLETFRKANAKRKKL